MLRQGTTMVFWRRPRVLAGSSHQASIENLKDPRGPLEVACVYLGGSRVSAGRTWSDFEGKTRPDLFPKATVPSMQALGFDKKFR